MLNRLINWWMRRCQHDGKHVVADLLEGDYPSVMVKWCRRCGATKLVGAGKFITPWRSPDPIEHP